MVQNPRKERKKNLGKSKQTGKNKQKRPKSREKSSGQISEQTSEQPRNGAKTSEMVKVDVNKSRRHQKM